MRISRGGPADLDDWVRMRSALWPEAPAEVHRAEAEFALGEPERWLILIARGLKGRPLGFAEASLRTDHVNGCETSPVVFLEGIWVEPDARRSGVARALVDEVEAWGRSHGCREFASDALAENTNSHAMHRALGFEETERVVYFVRPVAGDG
jgi:aminoglycoside 6'-N-acetyltransferase I